MVDVGDVVSESVLGDDVVGDPLRWVAPRPRQTRSAITTSTLGVFTQIEDRDEGAPVHWRPWSPVADKRVCSM
jgi:hypothetical protein